jgi:hypothetical protein
MRARERVIIEAMYRMRTVRGANVLVVEGLHVTEVLRVARSMGWSTREHRIEDSATGLYVRIVTPENGTHLLRGTTGIFVDPGARTSPRDAEFWRAVDYRIATIGMLFQLPVAIFFNRQLPRRQEQCTVNPL